MNIFLQFLFTLFAKYIKSHTLWTFCIYYSPNRDKYNIDWCCFSWKSFILSSQRKSNKFRFKYGKDEKTNGIWASWLIMTLWIKKYWKVLLKHQLFWNLLFSIIKNAFRFSEFFIFSNSFSIFFNLIFLSFSFFNKKCFQTKCLESLN